MDKIEAQFESYKKEVIPLEVSETQVRETKRAFFAGAAAMMTIFRVVGTDRVSESEGESILVDAMRSCGDSTKVLLKAGINKKQEVR